MERLFLFGRWPMSARKTSFFAGVRAELPILLGVVPFGLIYGATALAAGVSPLLAQAMSVIVFAGSAQFVIVQLFAGSVPPLVIAATAIIVNLRHLLYSASIAPYLQRIARRHRRLLAYLLTDEAFAVSMLHYQREPDEPAPGWYLAGAGLALWATWQLSTAAGIFLGASLPAWLPLDFALPLTFIALAVPAIRDRATAGAAITAGAAVLLARPLPFHLDLPVAALSGVLVGMLIERRQRSAPAPAEKETT
jgi:4-azaleucine resistance transporter AzlC